MTVVLLLLPNINCMTIPPGNYHMGNSHKILASTTGGIVMQLILGSNSKTLSCFYKGKQIVKYDTMLRVCFEGKNYFFLAC
jgi:hypothetical protein